MLRLLFVLSTFILATAPPVFAQRVDVGHSATSDIAVNLVGPFASLKVIAWKADSVHVSGFLSSAYRLENVFAGDPKLPSRGAKLYIDGPEEVTPKAAILELHVPANARVWIKGGTSELTVTGLTGEVDINMVGGTINVTGRPRTLSVQAIDASIAVEGDPEWMRLNTAAGNITMRGSSGDAAFTTVSGNVSVGGGSYDRARFESVNGNLAFLGDVARSASLLFDSHGGSVEVQLGAFASGPIKKGAADMKGVGVATEGASGVSIEAETLGGKIENMLSAVRPSARRDGRGQEIVLELGLAPGDARIVVRTFKGNVRLARRGA